MGMTTVRILVLGAIELTIEEGLVNVNPPPPRNYIPLSLSLSLSFISRAG